MNRAAALSVVVPALLCLSAAPSASAASPEEEYWAARTAFVEKLKGGSEAADKAALAQMQKRLRQIIGPSGVEGFPKPGRINLETLDSDAEGSFGSADGLNFSNGREALFITTPLLANLFAAGRLDVAKDMRAPDAAVLASDKKFIEAVFHLSAAVFPYADVPVKSREAESAAAFLGLAAQDEGAFVPDKVYVFATKGKRILMLLAPTKAPQIPACAKVKETEFQACYGREIARHPVFKTLQEQAQSIIDRLQKD